VQFLEWNFYKSLAYIQLDFLFSSEDVLAVEISLQIYDIINYSYEVLPQKRGGG